MAPFALEQWTVITPPRFLLDSQNARLGVIKSCGSAPATTIIWGNEVSGQDTLLICKLNFTKSS